MHVAIHLPLSILQSSPLQCQSKRQSSSSTTRARHVPHRCSDRIATKSTQSQRKPSPQQPIATPHLLRLFGVLIEIATSRDDEVKGGAQ